MSVTNVFHRNIQANTRIVVNQGGTRSSKTWSLCQLMIHKALTERGKLFTICRKTGPALRATVQKDFFDILKEYGLYKDKDYSRGEWIYRINGNEIAFISLDQSSKLRGRKNNYVWINEATEATYEDFTQLNIRLNNPSLDGKRNQFFCDYNPSEEFHWLYDKVIPRPDATFLKSTYRDNPFIDDETIRVIEALKGEDNSYYSIYALGEKAVSLENVYPHWEIVDEFPDAKLLDEVTYGIDFGFNNPCSLVKVGISDEAFYWEELLYESALTTPDIIKRLEVLLPNKRVSIFGDPARPEVIEDIRRAGYNIRGASNSVLEGIKAVKTKKLRITAKSVNGIREAKGYKWKTDSSGNRLEEPSKAHDHFMDAGRYGTYSAVKSTGKTVISIRTRK